MKVGVVHVDLSNWIAPGFYGFYLGMSHLEEACQEIEVAILDASMMVSLKLKEAFQGAFRVAFLDAASQVFLKPHLKVKQTALHYSSSL